MAFRSSAYVSASARCASVNAWYPLGSPGVLTKSLSSLRGVDDRGCWRTVNGSDTQSTLGSVSDASRRAAVRS